MTGERSAGQNSKVAMAVRTIIDLCAAPVTAVLDDIRELTMGTRGARFLFDFAGHCSAAYLILARPNKTSVTPVPEPALAWLGVFTIGLAIAKQAKCSRKEIL